MRNCVYPIVYKTHEDINSLRFIISISAYLLRISEKMKIPILIRLDIEYADKIKQLREMGFSPSEIMRQAVNKSIDEKLSFAKKMIK